MKVCSTGLYLATREKGYLCYYLMEGRDNEGTVRSATQILDIDISSNMLYLTTTTMT